MYMRDFSYWKAFFLHAFKSVKYFMSVSCPSQTVKDVIMGIYTRRKMDVSQKREPGMIQTWVCNREPFLEAIGKNSFSDVKHQYINKVMSQSCQLHYIYKIHRDLGQILSNHKFPKSSVQRKTQAMSTHDYLALKLW